MKTETQCNARMTRLGLSIKSAAMVMLSSLDPDGALHTRPMTPLEMDGDGRLWFFTDLHAANAANLNVANVSFADPVRGTYVSLPGRSEIDTDCARIESLWPSFANHAYADGPGAANLALLKFVPDATEDWDAPRASALPCREKI